MANEEKRGRRRHRNINGGISEGDRIYRKEENEKKKRWRILSFSIQLSGLTSYFPHVNASLNSCGT